MCTTRIIKRGMKPKYDVRPGTDALFISAAEIAAMLDELHKTPEDAIRLFTEAVASVDGTLSELAEKDVAHFRETLAIEDADEREYHFEMQDTVPREMVIELFAPEYEHRCDYIRAWQEAQAADRALAEAQMRWARAKSRFEAICADKP